MPTKSQKEAYAKLGEMTRASRRLISEMAWLNLFKEHQSNARIAKINADKSLKAALFAYLVKNEDRADIQAAYPDVNWHNLINMRGELVALIDGIKGVDYSPFFPILSLDETFLDVTFTPLFRVFNNKLNAMIDADLSTYEAQGKSFPISRKNHDLAQWFCCSLGWYSWLLNFLNPACANETVIMTAENSERTKQKFDTVPHMASDKDDYGYYIKLYHQEIQAYATLILGESVLAEWRNRNLHHVNENGERVANHYWHNHVLFREQLIYLWFYTYFPNHLPRLEDHEFEHIWSAMGNSKRNQLPKDLHQHLRTYFTVGVRVSEIAKALGVASATVSYWIDQFHKEWIKEKRNNLSTFLNWSENLLQFMPTPEYINYDTQLTPLLLSMRANILMFTPEHCNMPQNVSFRNAVFAEFFANGMKAWLSAVLKQGDTNAKTEKHSPNSPEYYFVLGWNAMSLGGVTLL